MRMLLSDTDRQSAEQLRGQIRAWDPQWLVDTVSAADEAFSLLETNTYQVLLWELATPGAAGLITLRRLKSSSPGSVLIVVALPGAEALARRSMAEGADAYLLRHPQWVSRLLTVLSQAEGMLRRNQESQSLQRDLKRAYLVRQALLDSLGSPAVLLSAEGRIQAANQLLARALRAPAEELVDTTLGRLTLCPHATEMLLGAALDEHAPLPEPSPGLLRAWREDTGPCAQILLRNQTGHYRLALLQIHILTSPAPAQLLARLQLEGEEPRALGTADAGTGGEALWQAEGLYTLLVDSQNHVLRVGAGLRRVLTREGLSCSSLTAGDFLDPAVLGQINSALTSEEQFQEDVLFRLPCGASRVCRLTALTLGDGPDRSYLWMAVPLGEGAPHGIAPELEQALGTLKQAVTEFPEAPPLEELPAHLLAVIQGVLPYHAGLVRLSPLAGDPAQCLRYGSRGLGASDAAEISERMARLYETGKLPPRPFVIADLDEYCRRSGDPALHTALAAEGLNRAVWLPLRLEEQTLGFMLLGFRDAGSFQPWVYRVLELAGATLGQLARAQALYHHAMCAVARDGRLLDFSARFHRAGTRGELVQELAEAAATLAPGPCYWVSLLDEWGEHGAEEGVSCPDPFVAQVLQPHVPNAAQEAARRGAPFSTPANGPGGLQGWLRSVPWVSQGEVIGALTLGHLGAEPADLPLADLLERLAGVAACALQGLRRLEASEVLLREREVSALRAQAEAAEAQGMFRASIAAAEASAPREALRQIADVAVQELNLHRLRIYVVCPQEDSLSLLHQSPPASGRGAASPERIPLDAAGDPRAQAMRSAAPCLLYSELEPESRGEGVSAHLALPVRCGGETRALLVAGGRSPEETFTPTQVRLLRGLGALVGLILDRTAGDESYHQIVSTLADTLQQRLQCIGLAARELPASDRACWRESELACLGRLTEAQQHLRLQADKVLKWSRLRAGLMQPALQFVDLPQLLRGVLSRWQEEARRRDVHLAAAEGAPVPAWATDPALLEQILDELLENALNFTPPGGQVLVRLACEPAAVSFEVSDTGPGIPPQHRQRIFREFERGVAEQSPTTEGLGLGLSVASHLARLLDGDLCLQSGPGQGSTFVLRLPPQVPQMRLLQEENSGRTEKT